MQHSCSSAQKARAPRTTIINAEMRVFIYVILLSERLWEHSQPLQIHGSYGSAQSSLFRASRRSSSVCDWCDEHFITCRVTTNRKSSVCHCLAGVTALLQHTTTLNRSSLGEASEPYIAIVYESGSVRGFVVKTSMRLFSKDAFNCDRTDIYNVTVTNDWSEARVDPLAALFIQRGGQTGKYQAVGLRAT